MHIHRAKVPSSFASHASFVLTNDMVVVVWCPFSCLVAEALCINLFCSMVEQRCWFPPGWVCARGRLLRPCWLCKYCIWLMLNVSCIPSFIPTPGLYCSLPVALCVAIARTSEQQRSGCNFKKPRKTLSRVLRAFYRNGATFYVHRPWLHRYCIFPAFYNSFGSARPGVPFYCIFLPWHFLTCC